MKLALIAGYLFVTVSASAQQPPASPGPSAQIITRSSDWPVDVQRVRAIVLQNLPEREFDVMQARIELPPDFTTRTQNPQLELRRIQEEGECGTLFVTMRCRDRRECGSFLVEIKLPKVMLGGRDEKTAELSGISFPSTAVLWNALVSKGSEPALVQPRTPARLVIEYDGLRITESVLPLKGGRLGEVVRVNDATTHHSMLAEVAGPGLLRPATGVNGTRRGGRQ
jgi:hypothetical protein